MNNDQTQIEDTSKIIQPSCSISEEDGTVRLTLEMPGVDRDNIEVNVEGNELIISAKNEASIPDKKYLIKERLAGKYRKRFIIDETIDRNKIEASMTDGVLTLILATKESAKPRKIEIR